MSDNAPPSAADPPPSRRSRIAEWLPRNWVPLFVLGVAVLTVGAPAIWCAMQYGDATLQYAEHHAVYVLPLLLAGSVAGFVSEFFGLWLVRRFDYGILAGNSAACLAALVVLIPPESAWVVVVSAPLGCIALLGVSAVVILRRRRRYR